MSEGGPETLRWPELCGGSAWDCPPQGALPPRRDLPRARRGRQSLYENLSKKQPACGKDGCAAAPGGPERAVGARERKGLPAPGLRPGSRPRAGGGTAPLSRPRALWPAAGPGEPKPAPARGAGERDARPAARGPVRTSASSGCFGGRKQPGELGGDVVFSVRPATLQCRLPVLCHLGQRAGERAYSSCTNNH